MYPIKVWFQTGRDFRQHWFSPWSRESRLSFSKLPPLLVHSNRKYLSAIIISSFHLYLSKQLSFYRKAVHIFPMVLLYTRCRNHCAVLPHTWCIHSHFLLRMLSGKEHRNLSSHHGFYTVILSCFIIYDNNQLFSFLLYLSFI